MITKLFATQITDHAYARINERLSLMVNNKDITIDEKNTITNNLRNILDYKFESHKSYGIMFGKFNINNNSKLITRKHPSGVYYTIDSFDKYDIIKDSTGNEFWGIIRGNRLITAFLRKTVQRNTAHKERNEGGLGVDIVIDDFEQYRNNNNIEIIRFTNKI